MRFASSSIPLAPDTRALLPSTGRLLDRAQPAIGMARDPCVRDPSRPAAVVRQRRPLSPLALQGKALEHRIDEQFLDLEHDIMLFRVDGDDLPDHIPPRARFGTD